MAIMSIIPYDLDWQKFVFTGYSATYSVTIIRHHFLVPLFFITLMIGLFFFKRLQVKWRKVLLLIVGLFWFFSMQTIAIVESSNVIVKGWSMIGVTKCDFNAKDSSDCSEIWDPLLRGKLEQELSNM